MMAPLKRALISIALIQTCATAFVTPRRIHHHATATTTATGSSLFLSTFEEDERRTLGLLTFDLDDTLYPIAVVEEEANRAFVEAMAEYGFADANIQPSNIVDTAQQIRDEISAAEGPQAAAALTHSELRLAAIRREMEKIIMDRKLKACAQEFATSVEGLSPVVLENAKKWAEQAVDANVVRAVSTAWEMERHHSAERNLYPEVLNVLKQIKEEHPTAIIGAVTDGRSDPKFMTFTLSPLFDFRCSWEDDQAQFQRKEFFQKLESTQGIQQLTWIYDEARYYYSVLKKAAEGMSSNNKSAKEVVDADDDKPLVFPATYDNRVWIHVGDDLAFDVGASSACGAKTIYCELANEYKQTARFRYTKFDTEKYVPEQVAAATTWSTTPQEELKARYEMAKEAEEKVTVKLQFLSQLPGAIDEILNSEP